MSANVVNVANWIPGKRLHTLTNDSATEKVESEILKNAGVHLTRGWVTVPIILQIIASAVLECNFVNDLVLLLAKGYLKQTSGIEMA